MASGLASSIPDAQRHRAAPQHILEENEQWLREQIESLSAMSEESKVAWQRMMERQARFIQTTQDIAKKQRALAGQIAGVTVCDLVALRGADPNANEADVPDCAAALRSLQPAGRQEIVDPGDVTLAHNWFLPRRPASFMRNVAFQEHSRRLPTRKEVGFFLWASLATGRVLHSKLFEYFIAMCVLANAVCIGIEIDMELLGQDTSFMVVLEYIFVSIYIVEVCMHFLADGPGCLRNSWNLLDFFLVVVGSVSIFFGDLLITLLRRSGASGDVTKGVHQLLVFRMVRLLRLARALRIMPMFRSLWKLVIGFFNALKTVASTVVLMTITLYIFACLGVEFITKDEVLRENYKAADLISERFASVPGVMLTLIQFATLDSISSIYYPVIMLRPWLSVYFMALLLTLSIVVMNLVTALIVEDALESTALDAEARALAMRKQIKSMIPAIKELFSALDRSGDGRIQIDEIIEGITSQEVDIPREMRGVVSLDRLMDLFEFLDLDGSGELDESEFVDGVCHLAITSIPVETTQILQLLRQQRRDLGMLRSDIHRLREHPAASQFDGSAARRLSGSRRSSVQERRSSGSIEELTV